MRYRDNYFSTNKSNHGWYTCVKCGRKMRKGDADIDHILPQNYGRGDGLVLGDVLGCRRKGRLPGDAHDEEG